MYNGADSLNQASYELNGASRRMEIITKRCSEIKVRQWLIFTIFLFYCYDHRKNSLATGQQEKVGLFFLCDCLIYVRLLNRSCLTVERKHVFNFRSVENDLSPDALVAGFTKY